MPYTDSLFLEHDFTYDHSIHFHAFNLNFQYYLILTNMKKLLLITFLGLGLAVLASASAITVSKVSQQEKKEAAVKTVYTCPMHPEIVQDKAGKCPKCGMNLTAKQVSARVYTCPMHPEIVQDKPGKCPKCGMNLALKEPEKKTNPPKK